MVSEQKNLWRLKMDTYELLDVFTDPGLMRFWIAGREEAEFG
jgi:hypothetical protein